ncbi:glycosyltransferase family 1 protein [Polynucleobacter sp. es-EL-1]|uniref:glycosyltransferase family 4 protein n=1 Tax=Polynucleobacter sp. es-EL-1 TaxID=1855652 RepID=UPI001BFE8335|nr:glycosyltransferase family 1 protein [Polynucleobacter sp. es-EL-1]QWE10885.1 glycosyltransferase family 4 protein [Polynucleobacter sp. es-EL-1]
MKIAIDISITDKTKTGTSIYVLELIKALKKDLPQNIELIYLRGPKSIKHKNIITQILNVLIQVYWLNIKIPLKVYSQKIDLVHFPANIVPFFRFCKTVVTIHDANFMREPETYNKLWSKYGLIQYINSSKIANRVITISEFSKKDIVKYFHAKEDNISVIYHGCRSLPINNDVYENNFGKYVLFVGGAFPSKNLPRLIGAFSKTSELNLVITGGEGSDIDNVKNLASQLNMKRKRVFILGFVSDQVLDQLYRNAHMFIFPSLTEGFGFPPLEAMRYGIPVTSSNSGSLPEILGKAAYFFNPLHEDEISESINIVSGDDKLRKKLIEEGYERVKKYSWKNCAKLHLNEYIKVFNNDFK